MVMKGLLVPNPSSPLDTLAVSAGQGDRPLSHCNRIIVLPICMTKTEAGSEICVNLIVFIVFIVSWAHCDQQVRNSSKFLCKRSASFSESTFGTPCIAKDQKCDIGSSNLFLFIRKASISSSVGSLCESIPRRLLYGRFRSSMASSLSASRWCSSSFFRAWWGNEKRNDETSKPNHQIELL